MKMSFWWKLIFLNELENIEAELKRANEMRAQLLAAPPATPPRQRDPEIHISHGAKRAMRKILAKMTPAQRAHFNDVLARERARRESEDDEPLDP